MSYRVKLNVFEGPFDLLVYLIEHAQMSIYDIKISEITGQYMAYVEDMQKSDVNLSSDFMVLAAALLEIKSKMLLPRAVSEDGTQELYEDPRTELVERLLEYKKFKTISEMLEDNFDEESMRLAKPQEDLTEYTKEADEYLSLDIDKFVVAFEQFLEKKKKLEQIREHHIRTEKQRITTELRMKGIRSFFQEQKVREADFTELVEKKQDRYDVAVTFSSVLEMMKERRLDAEQKYVFGNIRVKATELLFEKEI
ncbi:MAG: segregation/condensation protein A [Clostridiales bacterium]|nr:segregation/condensation protein A [Clostridiales bacterium]